MKESKTTSLPDGWGEQTASWHHEKFTEFTKYKQEIGEPSPHLAIVGWMCQDKPVESKLWLLGCYAATYCLPTAQVLWETWKPSELIRDFPKFEGWLNKNWEGIITRQERRCVRTPRKMADCLKSYLHWMREEYPKLHSDGACSGIFFEGNPEEANAYYDRVWESVEGIRYFGRYINIRLVEGLRRYCDIPARLYDVRSIGGWSPKKCLAYLYPKHADKLLIDNREGNILTNRLFYKLLSRVRREVPTADEYVIAAMLCEFKGSYEKRHQYPGWTIDQEPLLYDKVLSYWKDKVDTRLLWSARESLFPAEVLGEKGSRWNGTRWDLAATLRDHGYNWSDLRYDYVRTLQSGDFSKPKLRRGKCSVTL